MFKTLSFDMCIKPTMSKWINYNQYITISVYQYVIWCTEYTSVQCYICWAQNAIDMNVNQTFAEV